ncbi:MAG: hypothetical protein R2745_07960 [Vicinamibacterales bacterium]
MRIGGRVATVLVCVAATTAGGCGGPPPRDVAPPAVATAIAWREVGSWSGRINRQTESFEVSTTPMRLRWRTMNEVSPGAGHLTVTLHSAVSGRLLQTIVDAGGVAEAAVDVADEPHWAYLAIAADGIEYQMTLEQAFAAEPR